MSDDQTCQFECFIRAPREKVFAVLIEQLERWWTTVFDAKNEGDLLDVGIDPQPGGTCSETSSDGQLKTWGTVLSIEPPLYVRLAWQVSSAGSSLVDPAAASRVMISLRQAGEDTRLELVHTDFIRHGDDAAACRALMCANTGWPLRLNHLANACR
ncbi:SRPBCC domain-containing protein [uncultured Roseibium sp.]|uniref:SRPBCC domain-containing protein n=1 Tax=uncultured Roseibium sp. TaxID=1936171 RepID=UPI002596750D|nr:SRPBCC domain-containing protein [uncultured Roseibium sp.]